MMKIVDFLAQFAAWPAFNCSDVRATFKVDGDKASKMIKYAKIAGYITEFFCAIDRGKTGTVHYRVLAEQERRHENAKSMSRQALREQFSDSRGFTIDDMGVMTKQERELNRTQLYRMARSGEIVRIGDRPSSGNEVISLYVFKHNVPEETEYPPELDILFNKFIGGRVQHHPQGRVYSFA